MQNQGTFRKSFKRVGKNNKHHKVMKTKTFLLIVLFSIGISTSSFAQNQGATLTQTIEWIKSYLAANGVQLIIKGSDGKYYLGLESITFDSSTKILFIKGKPYQGMYSLVSI